MHSFPFLGESGAGNRRFSSKFYERLGDDVAGELVDWCNTVDETYRNQLREMNELSWERFKAHLDGRLAELRGEVRTEMANMRADLIKWMFLIWLGNAGLMLGLRFFGPK